jgi:hypothetical protein
MDFKSMLKNLWLTSSLCNPHPDILHMEVPTSSSPTSHFVFPQMTHERERERERVFIQRCIERNLKSKPKAAVKISSNL